MKPFYTVKPTNFPLAWLLFGFPSHKTAAFLSPPPPQGAAKEGEGKLRAHDVIVGVLRPNGPKGERIVRKSAGQFLR